MQIKSGKKGDDFWKLVGKRLWPHLVSFRKHFYNCSDDAWTYAIVTPILAIFTNLVHKYYLLVGLLVVAGMVEVLLLGIAWSPRCSYLS